MPSEKDRHTGNQENCDTNFNNQHTNLFRRDKANTLEQPERRQDDAYKEGDRYADGQDSDGDGEHHQGTAHKVADEPHNPHTLSMRLSPEGRCRKQHSPSWRV